MRFSREQGDFESQVAAVLAPLTGATLVMAFQAALDLVQTIPRGATRSSLVQGLSSALSAWERLGGGHGEGGGMDVSEGEDEDVGVGGNG